MILFFKAQPAPILRTLYVARPVRNAAGILAWARQAGIPNLMRPDDLHVTIAFSRAKVDHAAMGRDAPSLTVAAGTAGRAVTPLGDKGAVVLRFESPELRRRWQQFRDGGASWSYPGYHPHITLSYQAPGAVVPPYAGPIELGPERFQEVVEDWEKAAQQRAT